MGVGYLDIITEYVVVSDFKRGYTRGFAFAHLQPCQIVFALVCDCAQLVEFTVNAVADNVASGGRTSGIVGYFAGNAFLYRFAGIQLLANGFELRHLGFDAHAAYFHYGAQGVAHLKQLARRYTFAGYFGDEALKVAYRFELVGYVVAQFGVLEKILHHIKAFVDWFGVAQRQLKPAAQQTRAHRSDGAVYDAQQAFTVGVERLEKLEVAYCEAVETHRLAFVYP